MDSPSLPLENSIAELEKTQSLLAEAIRSKDEPRKTELMAEIRRLREAEEKAAREEVEHNKRRDEEARKQEEAKAAEEAERKTRREAERKAAKEAEREKRKREALEKISGHDAERPWIIEPYLLESGLTKITAPVNELNAASDFMAALAAKIDGDIVLATNTPALFASKFVAAGGHREKLKFLKELNFSDPRNDDRGALLELDIRPRLYVFPNLLEYVPKSGSQSFSEDVLSQLRNMADDAAVIFGWPSSTRREATGCSIWTNAGDVKLTLADIQPAEDAEPESNSNRDFARGFITCALSTGPRPLKELLASARKHSIRETVFYGASRELRVESARNREKFGESVWSLPQTRENIEYCAGLAHSDASGE